MLETTVKEILSVLKISSLNGVYEDIVLTLDPDSISITAKDASEKVSVMHKGVYTNFKPDVKERVQIGIHVNDLIKMMNTLFKPDELVKFEIEKNDLIITGDKHKITTSVLDPKSVKTNPNTDKLFMLDADNTMIYQGGKVKPTTVAKFDSSILSNIETSGSLVKQEFYPITITPPNTIEFSVGDRKKSKANDKIDFKDDSIEATGDVMKTIIGSGLKNVVSVLNGDIQVSGLNGSPLWIWYEDDDKKLGFFIASRVESQ